MIIIYILFGTMKIQIIRQFGHLRLSPLQYLYKCFVQVLEATNPKTIKPRLLRALSLYGGARRDRTADLLHAMQALSQLSYGPEGRAFNRAPLAMST